MRHTCDMRPASKVPFSPIRIHVLSTYSCTQLCLAAAWKPTEAPGPIRWEKRPKSHCLDLKVPTAKTQMSLGASRTLSTRVSP